MIVLIGLEVKIKYDLCMKILLYSGIDARKESCGFQRVGHHISHLEYKSRSFNLILGRDVNYFELDFQLVC